MKFIAFNGSPAGANSATNVLCRAFLQGAERAGAECENIFLAERKIEYCRGCFGCWFQTPGRCVINDDMRELLGKYRQADVVCLATPVFTWNMTANLKAFVDRLAPLKSPLITQQDGNFDLADSQPKTQKFVAIANCGFPGENNFAILKAAMSPCAPVLEIYRNCGKLLKSQDPQIQAKVGEYLKIVEQAGFELAAEGQVSPATEQALNMELLPVQEYIAYLGM